VKLKRPSPINASDYARMMALWEAAGLHVKPQGRDSHEAFARQIAGGTQTAIGIENETGELVGVTLATHDGRKGWINRLAVHPDARRQGIGEALIAAAEQRLHQQGIDVIAALIEPENVASLSLFIKSGYAEWPGLHYVSKRSSDEA
jgi:N-acetylglutamate synthase